MIWTALLGVLLVTLHGAVYRITAREWVVQSGFLALSLLAAVLIAWHVWPNLRPLAWLYSVFEPPTRGFYNVL